MATQTVTTLVDDIDGSTDDVVTCAFGLGNFQFEIDLNAEHREELESVLAKFLESARPVGAPVHSRRSRQTAKRVGRSDREQTQAVRQWAKENGYEVSERGRISNTVVDAFEAAH
ncbi:histone-like nucleoid-structuring protein Lsr2 [Nakamurella sp.]|uniref:histone-like nucleoid-structuring protein Lsr2 n=1 Tax=Nakamurella sp. TaxID=1869182 RepID=UPI003B3B55F1